MDNPINPFVSASDHFDPSISKLFPKFEKPAPTVKDLEDQIKDLQSRLVYMGNIAHEAGTKLYDATHWKSVIHDKPEKKGIYLCIVNEDDHAAYALMSYDPETSTWQYAYYDESDEYAHEFYGIALLWLSIPPAPDWINIAEEL